MNVLPGFMTTAYTAQTASKKADVVLSYQQKYIIKRSVLPALCAYRAFRIGDQCLAGEPPRLRLAYRRFPSARSRRGFALAALITPHFT
jgi:hypothetical protein